MHPDGLVVACAGGGSGGSEGGGGAVSQEEMEIAKAEVRHHIQSALYARSLVGPHADKMCLVHTADETCLV